jgi:hypothetical protein
LMSERVECVGAWWCVCVWCFLQNTSKTHNAPCQRPPHALHAPPRTPFACTHTHNTQHRTQTTHTTHHTPHNTQHTPHNTQHTHTHNTHTHNTQTHNTHHTYTQTHNTQHTCVMMHMMVGLAPRKWTKLDRAVMCAASGLMWPLVRVLLNVSGREAVPKKDEYSGHRVAEGLGNVSWGAEG